MSIDPLETIIKWLGTAGVTGVSTRVAGKHRYGNGWTENESGMSVHLDGGAPDLYAPVATPRFEVRIYADDQVKVVGAWRDLVRLSRENERFVVAVSGGNALVHFFKPASGLSMPYDETLRMDMGVVFFDCMIAEEAVS